MVTSMGGNSALSKVWRSYCVLHRLRLQPLLFSCALAPTVLLLTGLDFSSKLASTVKRVSWQIGSSWMTMDLRCTLPPPASHTREAYRAYPGLALVLGPCCPVLGLSGRQLALESVFESSISSAMSQPVAQVDRPESTVSQ